MKGKRIEPGCLALITGAIRKEIAHLAVGRVVRVVGQPAPHWIPPGANYPRLTPWPPDAWVIESIDDRMLPLPVTSLSSGRLHSVDWNRQASARECYLIRLDDDEAPEETHTTEQHKEKV